MGKAIYEKKNRIAYVTLNRPESMNALDEEMNDELWAIWRDFNDDPSVDVAILTGAGKFFAQALTSRLSFRNGNTPRLQVERCLQMKLYDLAWLTRLFPPSRFCPPRKSTQT